MKTKIGIVGCGAIGEGVALFIDKRLNNKALLWALADKEEDKAWGLRSRLRSKPQIMDIDCLIKEAGLVVEAASVEAARYILNKAVAAGKDVVILSVGALVGNNAIIKRAEKKGAKIYIPSGAICGTDGLGSLSLGKVKKVSLITSKPPQGLAAAKYLKDNNIDISGLKKPRIIFKGKVKEAIKYFPQNINVAATLMLAASSDKVEVCIKADPSINRNIHVIEIEASDAKVSIRVENVPSKGNPKTSALAVLSTQYLLKKMFSSLKIGG